MLLAAYFLSLLIVAVALALAPRWLRSFGERASVQALSFARRICARASRAADFLLQDRGSHYTNQSSLLNWVVINLLVIGLASLPLEAIAIVLAIHAIQIAFAAVNLILIAAFLLKAQQDDLAINSVNPPAHLFRDSPAVDDLKVLLTTVVLVILHLTSIVQFFDGPWSLLSSKPDASIPFVDYLIAVSSALPVVNWVTNLALLAAERTTNQEIKVAFADGFGHFVGGSIFFIGSFFLLGAVTLRYRQRKEIYGLVEALRGPQSEEMKRFAQIKIERAPRFINTRLLEAAVTPTTVGDQRHVIDLALTRRIHSFTRRFTYELGRQDRDVKEYGLEKSLDAIMSGAFVFDYAMAKSTLVPIVNYASTRVRGTGIRTQLYVLALAILDKAHGRALTTSNLESWRSEQVLSYLSEMIIETATRDAKIHYDEIKDSTWSIHPQEMALRVAIDFDLIDLPLKFVETLQRSGNEFRTEGLIKIRRYCEGSDRFRASGSAEVVAAAIDSKTFKMSERTKSALAELKACVQRISAGRDVVPPKRRNLAARLFRFWRKQPSDRANSSHAA